MHFCSRRGGGGLGDGATAPLHPVLNSQSVLGNKDVKIMKNLTIILIGSMTLALKVLAMLTLSMGSLTLKCALLIYGWLPAHITLVTGVAIFQIELKE